MRRAKDREATIARQRAWIEKAGHRPNCRSRSKFMVGGISMDVNVRPNAHEVSPSCDCGFAELVGGEMDGRTHWEGCWREHLECAVARVEVLESSPQRLAEPFYVGNTVIGRGCKVSTAQLAVNRLADALKAALKGEG